MAARDRLTSDVEFAQKVELRLNDLARIVDGSLARQSAELDAAQARIATLEEDLTRALARAEQAAGDASRADRLSKENGELRSMVMTLLDVIEGRQKSSLASVMQKLEENVTALVQSDVPAAVAAAAVIGAAPEEQAGPAADEAVEETPEEPTPAEPTPAEPTSEAEVELHDLGPEPVIEVELEAEPVLEADEDAVDVALDELASEETELEETEPEETQPEETAPMEDLSEIALYDASEEVVEPGKG